MRCCQTEVLLLFGCITCLHFAPAITDGRVFVLELSNSTGQGGHGDAERACASQYARLASAEDLKQAVVDCFFSTCTHGWLYGGTVGKTVCNMEGSTLKAVDVRTDNVTEDITKAFCIKDKGKPCGDPPSFPHAHLQGHTGFELGDELLYSCMPGYVMPEENNAFSLLCDSCGEWYGLVQLCVKDDGESHVDYEDKFMDSYKQPKGPEEAQSQVYQEVQDAIFQNEKTFLEHSDITFDVDEAKSQHEQAALDEPAMPSDLSKKLLEAPLGGELAEEGDVGDIIVNQNWGQEMTEVVRTEEIPTTHSPVSLLSQKHMFWFPSEAFHDGHPVSMNSATPSSTGVQSNESKEQESREQDQQQSLDQVETFDSHLDNRNDSQSHEHDHLDSHQEKDDPVTIFIPTQHNVDISSHEGYDDSHHHDDHYDMGEHDEDRIPSRYDSSEHKEPEQTYDESFEDHRDGQTDVSQENTSQDNYDDTEEPYNPDDNDSYEENSRQHVIFTIDGGKQNASRKATGAKATTDDTWLDGYPIVQKEVGQDDSTTGKEQDLQMTENPNEIDAFLNTGLPNTEPSLNELEKDGATAAAHPEPSDSHSNSDTIDYDTQQAAPTNTWFGDLTEHPYLDQGPVPPLNDLDILAGPGGIKEHTIDNHPGETGEKAEVEGEKGEAVCADDNCPPRPPSLSRRGPTVAAIIIAVCVVAAAVIMGVWCYRRQLQKSSVYDMNGKGQSQKRQGQQIEMQQKV